jgi:cytochrome oxidase Cu insertion factor (SCO1/SenC/PrrC family)
LRSRRNRSVRIGIGCVCAAATVAFLVSAVGAGTKRDEDSAPQARPELELGRTPQYDYDPPEPGTYQLPVVMSAADGNVLTPDGKHHRLRELLEGRVTLLSFIYTRCADPTACPIATGALYTIHSISEKDATLEKNLRLITFSFDPEHDTPTVMANYSRGLHPEDSGSDWLFLTTKNADDLQPILSAYGQRVDRKSNVYDPLGPFYHLLRVYLIDGKGQIRNIYSFGLLDPRMVLTDVRTLLLEDETRAASD